VPFSEYQIYLVAKGEKNKVSENSDTINQYTDVDGPGPPTIMNATCIPGTSGTSIFLQWAPPEHFYKSVDEYFISVAKEHNDIMKFKVLLPKDNFNLSVRDLLYDITIVYYLNACLIYC